MTTFRAPNEYAWAAFFDALDVPWKYEALEPDISRAIQYQPDFWLPDSMAWIEIKALRHVPTPGEARAARHAGPGHPAALLPVRRLAAAEQAGGVGLPPGFPGGAGDEGRRGYGVARAAP